MHRPEIESGSSAWRADILAIKITMLFLISPPELESGLTELRSAVLTFELW